MGFVGPKMKKGSLFQKFIIPKVRSSEKLKGFINPKLTESLFVQNVYWFEDDYRVR